MKGQWTNIYSGDLPLRSWWVDSGNECQYVCIVLPEVFGINNWIRSFSEKLAAENVPVIALPLYGRTAPNLDLAYCEEDLKLGRHHKNLTTLKNIIEDVSAAINWVIEKYSKENLYYWILFWGKCSTYCIYIKRNRKFILFYGAGVTAQNRY